MSSLVTKYCHQFDVCLVCAGTQTIDPPKNLSVAWYYPTTWNYSNIAPQYAANQNCSWIFNIPKGMFVSFSLTANTASSTTKLTMTDSLGYVSTFSSVTMETYYLVAPSFRVDLQSTQVGTFGMVVQWFTIDPNATSNAVTYQVHSASSPLILYGGNFDLPTVIQADTLVSLLPFWGNILLTSFMRITQVYDGPSIDSQNIGNLYNMASSGQNIKSSGKTLTIFSLYPGIGAAGNPVILQDYSDVKQFKSYKAIACIVPNMCELSLDATQGGPVAAVRLSRFYVKNIAMPSTNTLSVYTNYVATANKLSDYTSATAKTNIPQLFNGKLTTFVLDQGTATVVFSGDSIDSKWSTAFEGRRGFFTSPNYATNSTEQSFNDQISSSTTFDISYTIDGSSIVGNSVLNVMIKSNQKAVIDNSYSTKNYPGGLVKATGDFISVNYQSQGSASVGPLITFRFDKHNSAMTHGFLLAIAVSIWRLF
ncbi:hypothetical protein GCK72_005153 [Caenorhabditis remanei]|uniref:Uncharacterized protein n=1 Tax=Caenorhabditis remanei TaxID=31234 RepID=A0A6A5HE76_CAERE|nr:hypothetical protein GCK72_005153 [Caenorhabditis remanei]KAF1765201.1 hypothetical protein GCK72_005153 [Caenorhabditis remanei]